MTITREVGTRDTASVAKLFWDASNWSDRLFLGWYAGLGLALLFVSPQLEILTLHVGIIVTIVLVTSNSSRNRWWRFAHDWYPFLIFIAAFEEVARLSLVFIPQWQDSWILRLESSLFAIPPTAWLRQWQNPLLVELLEFGYFTFYWIMPLVGGILYADKVGSCITNDASNPRQPFRAWMDATVLGYIICFIVYLAFPTEGPAHTLASNTSNSMHGGLFHWLVRLIQHHAGVHGNALPSAHVMASAIALLAALRWKRRLGFWLLMPVLLMGLGAVYDGYHYVSDVVLGAIVGIVVFCLTLKMTPAGRPSFR